jgi:hypothetical protein
LESMGKSNEVFRKTTGMEFGKWTARSTVGLQRIKDSILWKGQPLQNGKRNGG